MMKPATSKRLTLITVLVCLASVAFSQSNTNELQIKAKASLLADTNSPRIFLTIYLVNTNAHELTVLTKNLNWATSGESGDKLVFEAGYGGAVKYEGHPIIPSLYDFAPVTLRPNEQALIRQEITNGLDALGKRTGTPLVVRYRVAPEWGKRFAVWNGSVETTAFAATVRK